MSSRSDPVALSTSERVGRLIGGHGLIGAPFDVCVRDLGSEELGAGRSTWSEVGRTDDPARALDFFSTYTFPATLHLLFPLGDGWTAAVNNSRHGSDFADDRARWSRATGSRTIRVVDRDALTWRRGSEREVLRYEARIVELRDERDRELRTIACASDGGRWTWHVSGEPLPVESGFPYDAKRIRDRFTRTHLRAFLAAVPAPALDVEGFLGCRRFSLVEETVRNADWMARIRAGACTETERDDPAHGYFARALGWMEHLGTHAGSAVADFEKALRLNPDYEARIRPHLERARRAAGR